MKRAIALLACLALLALGGCALPRNGVKWTTIDLLDEAYADVKAWLSRCRDESFLVDRGSVDLTDTYELAWDWDQVFLNDKRTNESKPILDGMRLLGFQALRGDYAYLSNAWGEDSPPSGKIRLIRIDLTKLPDIEYIDLLEGVRWAQFGAITPHSRLSPEGKTFVVVRERSITLSGDDRVDIYDLESRRFLATVPGTASRGRCYYYDENTIYYPIFEHDENGFAVYSKAIKITLP